MNFLLLLRLHISMVTLSGGLFVLRGLWMLADSPRLQRRWVKVVPHLIDTVLLASGIGLALLIRQYPFADGWLTAKLVALVAYIVLGTIALKRGRTKAGRVTAWLLALATFAYIVAVARSQSPLPPVLSPLFGGG